MGKSMANISDVDHRGVCQLVPERQQPNKRIWLFKAIAMLILVSLYIMTSRSAGLRSCHHKVPSPAELVDEVLKEVPLIGKATPPRITSIA